MKDKKKNKLNRTFVLYFFVWVLFLAINSNSTFGQKTNNNCFPVLFYNVENFFDCYDDTLKNDEEFLPDSPKKWTFYRFNNKANKIAKVILASNNWNPPALAGLCETENKNTLNRLVWEAGLSEAGYRYIHHESPDKRGIDVALLYRKDMFRVISEKAITVSIPQKNLYTRDILYVKGIFFDDDTLNVLVCHFPSKYGGAIHSEWKRAYVAGKLREVCDSIFTINLNSHIVIMGDFNETPDDPAIHDILKAGEKGSATDMINLSFGIIYNTAKGTIKYKGQWSVFDQIIVSASLMDPPFKTSNISIVDLPFLLEPDEAYSGKKPYRTYNGPKYLGGFSDHLPVKAVICK